MDHADGHRYFEGLAVAHVLGGLDDSEGRVFRSHLLECSTCRARVGELRAIAHDLADVERDERRVRAAQAIDTKRREADEDVDDTIDPIPPTRSSRISVVVGLVLVLGLSLWNFTLRGELTVQETAYNQLIDAGVVNATGEEWVTTPVMDAVQGSVRHAEDQMVLAVDGLEPSHLYYVYLQDASGQSKTSLPLRTFDEGRIYRLLPLGEGVVRLTLTDQENVADGEAEAAEATDLPVGDTVLQATRP